MKFLVSTGSIREFDPILKTMVTRFSASPEISVKNPSHKPIPPIFGIARWGDRVVATCSKNSMDHLLVLSPNFDIESSTIIQPIDDMSGSRQLHQVRVFGDRAFICDTRTNRVVIVDLNTKDIVAHDITEPNVPRQHLNSITKIGDQFFLVCHRMGPSVIKVLDATTMEQVDEISMGVKAHDVWMMGGKLWTCSSGEGKLVAQDGDSIPIGGFPRGIYQTASTLYVGMSGRYRRVEGDFVRFENAHNAKIKYLNIASRTVVDEYEVDTSVITDMA